MWGGGVGGVENAPESITRECWWGFVGSLLVWRKSVFSAISELLTGFFFPHGLLWTSDFWVSVWVSSRVLTDERWIDWSRTAASPHPDVSASHFRGTRSGQCLQWATHPSRLSGKPVGDHQHSTDNSGGTPIARLCGRILKQTQIRRHKYETSKMAWFHQ